MGRIEMAKKLKSKKITHKFSSIDVDEYKFEMFIKVFKLEQAVQVWVRDKNSDDDFKLLTQFAFCKISGVLGPKRKENDLQVPEGLYHIDRFNPQSKFYLSLGLNYPNASDLILSDKDNPGKDIFIHGGCSTVGCIPISDSWISELYLIAERAKKLKQKNIPVYIFPFVMNEAKTQEFNEKHPHNAKFWKNLRLAFDKLEKNNKPISFKVGKEGEYIID